MKKDFCGKSEPINILEKFIYYVNTPNAKVHEVIGVSMNMQLHESFDDWMIDYKDSMFSSYERFFTYLLNH